MFDRNLMKLEGMPALLGCLALLALMQAALVVGQAAFLSQAIAKLWAGDTLGQSAHDIIGFLACFSALHLARFAQEQMLDIQARKLCAQLRVQLMQSALAYGSALTSRFGSTRIALAATTGMQDVENYLRIIPPKMLGLVFIALPVLGFVFKLDVPSGVILAVMFPVIIFFMILLGKQSKQRAERQYASYLRLSNRFIDTLRGLEVVLSSGAQARESQSVHDFSERLRKATVGTLTTATLSSAVLDLCATFGVAAVAMMLAFRLMDGSVDLATGLAALILAPEFFLPIRSFAGDFHASLDGKNALADVLGMLAESGGSPDEDARQAAAVHTPWTTDSKLVLNDVSYSYDGSREAVSHITLTFTGFESVALMGSSGSGKTTLAALLAGLKAPTSGAVEARIGGICYTSRELVGLVRYIPQTPTIFHMTLAENVAFYNPHATRSQIEGALEAVGLKGLVDELPDGIDTRLGEGGRGLSGGQSQRIALARVLVDPNAAILVLDEPTAHLDLPTEYELKEIMQELFRGRLVILATHRGHWASSLDRTVVLDGGRIVSDNRAGEVG